MHGFDEADPEHVRIILAIRRQRQPNILRRIRHSPRVDPE
jgi:hypothetical protein